MNATATPLSNPRYPALSVVGSHLRVAWREGDSSSPWDQVWMATFTDGAWDIVPGPLPAGGPGTSYIKSIELQQTSRGEPLLAWTEWTSSPDQVGVYLAHWRAPNAFSPPEWTAPETVQATALSALLPRLFLEVDWDGHPWVAWTRRSGQYTDETVYRRKRSSGWDAEQLVVGDPLNNFRLDPSDFPWFQAYGGLLLRPQ